MLLEILGFDVWPSRDPRFNVAPTSMLDVLAINPDGKPAHQKMQWGLKAPWAKAGKSSPPLINARAESLFEKPTFRNLAKNHRIVIPITGFYEWHRDGKNKTPHLITSASERALLVGGIAQPKDEDDTGRACVVTTSANQAMSPVHHRMPVLLNREETITWLTGGERRKRYSAVDARCQQRCHKNSSSD